MRSWLRWTLAILTGLWVTTGVAVPIGFVQLTALRSRNAGELGPELLSEPPVLLLLLSGYAFAAAIGGWAAGWVMIENGPRLAGALSLCYLGAWVAALVTRSLPLPGWFALSLAAAAVVGTGAGVGLRAWQVGRRAGPWARR